jgi:hypothetical protein
MVAWSLRFLTVSEPAFHVGAMDDAEHKNDPVLVDDVIHQAIVPNAESVKGVREALDRLDRLTPDTARSGGLASKLLEGDANPRPDVGRQLPKLLRRTRCQLDPIRTQPRSCRLTVRPLA